MQALSRGGWRAAPHKILFTLEIERAGNGKLSGWRLLTSIAVISGAGQLEGILFKVMAVAETRKNTIKTGITGRTKAAGALLALLVSAQPCLSTPKSVLDSPMASPEARNKLLQIEKRRQELHERVMQVRQRERAAIAVLDGITRRLNRTTGELRNNKRDLKKTENKITETEQVLVKTQTREQALSAMASKRLREIYQGQRLSFVEMLFQMDSLQNLLDRMYFQERIASEDRKLLEELRAKAATLHQRRGFLDEQKRKIGDIVSEIAKKAMAVAREKFQQEKVADKLRTQRAFYEQAERQLAMESQRLETQILEMENSQKKSKGPIQHGSGNLSMPLKAHITSPFGWRRHPIFGVRRFHSGIDLAGPNRSAIRSADSGSVLYTGWYGGYGKVVIVSHGNGMATLYAHLSRTAVSVGQNVSKGDVIGYEGTTGFSTGPHLHFEVRVNGKPNNPLNYLR